METLSLGKHNPRLIAIRKAIREATLTPEGLLPIEGPKLVQEAVRSGIEIASVFVRKGCEPQSIPRIRNVYVLDDSTFKTIQSTETSQGIIALVRPRTYTFSDILSVTNPLLVILARLQDPGNVGTILRVAESFYATACLAVTGTASPYNPKTIRASAGSLFRLPHLWDLNLQTMMTTLRDANVSLVGTSPDAERTIESWDWKKPVALVVGNEGTGLSDDEMRMCDAVLRVPQNPEVESLNTAVATAVILYEASRNERFSL